MLYISSNKAKYIFKTHCKLIINNVEIIACKLALFKNPIIDFINQEISRKGEINCNCVCAINRQNYDPCQYGTPSLNISPGDRVECWVKRLTVSERVSDTVKVTLCKAPRKHKNNKDDMSCTPSRFSLVKSILSHFPAMKLLVTCCNNTCPSPEAKFLDGLRGKNRFLELSRNQEWNL